MEMTDFVKNNEGDVTCDVIRDIMPLVADGVASDDSARLLEQHIGHCAECMSFYNDMRSSAAVPPIAAPDDDKKIMSRIRKRYVLFVAMIMMIGAMVGVHFIDTEFIFQNFLLMPLVGALSYVCFKEKGAIMAGAVILMSLLRGAVILLSTHPDDAAGSVEVGFIMAIFALLGFFAAWLLAFAFRREKK